MRYYAAVCIMVSIFVSSCATFTGSTTARENPRTLPPYSVNPVWKCYTDGILIYRYSQRSPGFRITALKIDLSSPDRKVVISRGIKPAGQYSGKYNFHSTTVKRFMREERLIAAINATPFEPYRFISGLKQSAVGVVKSKGVLYSMNDRYDVICFTGKNGIVLDSPPYRFLSGSENAAGGFFIILSGGDNIAFNSPPDARSLAGTDRTGKILFLAVIDGGLSGKRKGATFYEAAEWMKYLGADDALCLDGGGSSVMAARRDPERKITVLNSPEGGALLFFKRLSPVFIGIR